MSIDEDLKMLHQGTLQQQRIALQRIGFRLTVATRNSDRSLDALKEALLIRTTIFDEICSIAAGIHRFAPEVRIAAIQVLGQCLDSRAVPLLTYTASESYEPLSRVSYSSLFRIGTIQAHQCIRSAYKQQRPDSEQAFFLGSCMGHYSLPRWLLWRLLARSTRKAMACYEEAEWLYRRGDRRAAIKRMWAATYHWPSECVFWLTLGEWLIQSGQEGIGLLRFGALLRPFEPETLQRLAQALGNRNHPDDLEMAHYWYSQIIELEPGPISLREALTGRGDVLIKLYKPSDAAWDYRRALSVLKSDPFFETPRQQIKQDLDAKLRALLRSNPDLPLTVWPEPDPIDRPVSVPSLVRNDMVRALDLQSQAQRDPNLIGSLIEAYERILERLRPGEYLDFRSAIQNYFKSFPIL